jgi:hypothetical protein
LIATQVPVQSWIEHIGDPTLADAIFGPPGSQRPQPQSERRFHEKNPFVLDEIRQVWKVGKHQRRFAPIKWTVCSGTGGHNQAERVVSLSGIRTRTNSQYCPGSTVNHYV